MHCKQRGETGRALHERKLEHKWSVRDFDTQRSKVVCHVHEVDFNDMRVLERGAVGEEEKSRKHLGGRSWSPLIELSIPSVISGICVSIRVFTSSFMLL